MAWEPKDWRTRNADNVRHGFDMLGIVNQMDNFDASRDRDFDYLRRAEELAFQTNKIRRNAALERGKNAALNVSIQQPKQAPLQGQQKQAFNAIRGGGFKAFINAIAGQESGGNYSAVNKDSGAAGKYQIMPANFVNQGGWDYDALGRDVSLQEYLNHPKIQERIARNKLREYFQKYGAAGAASAWYSGDPNKWNSKTPQGSYPSIHAYVMQILDRMGQ